MSECKYGIKTCKCHECACNAAKDGCNHGYCITCFECDSKHEALHNVYLCTGFEPAIDAVPISSLIELRDWLYEHDAITLGGRRWLDNLIGGGDNGA